MRKGQRATNSQHRGVQIIKKGEKTVLRYKDPITGRYRDRSLGVVTRGFAIDAALAQKEQLEALKKRWVSGYLTPDVPGVDQVQDFVEAADTDGTKNIRHQAANYIRRMQAGMLNRTWHELQRHDLLRLQQMIHQDRKLGPTTKNLRLKTCRHFFNWMHDRGSLGSLDSALIAKSLKPVKAPDHKHGKILTPNQLQKVFAIMLKDRPEMGLFYILKATTGLRLGELVNIHADDVVSGQGVKSHLRVYSPKTNSNRKINLSVSPLAHSILENLKQRNSGYFFSPKLKDRSDKVRLYRSFQCYLTETLKRKHGVTVTPKDFRSSNEAYLVGIEGWDIFRVAKQLGHSTAIAHKSYTEEIQMMDLPSGKTLEQAMGLEEIGHRMLLALDMQPDLAESVIRDQLAQDWLDQNEIQMLLDRDLNFDLSDLVKSIQGQEPLTQSEVTLAQDSFSQWFMAAIKKSTGDEERQEELQHTFKKVNKLLLDRVQVNKESL